jgi:ABC-type dipeptide/oligopeptide/nickel transport system ATPase component
MSAVLSVGNVTINFATSDGAASAPAVDGVSIEVSRAEILGIVGESGSGKSTLANAVMGLLPVGASVTGSIRLNGCELVGLHEDELRRIRGVQMSMIFQDASASLDPIWPVGDQIAESLRAHRTISRRNAKARAVELMAEMGIPDAASRYHSPPHRFSGGMRQRIVIAAALANNPGLLIADEPTTALDVTIQAQVLQLIDRLRREHGTTVILITHDLGVVSQVCDRVAVMYGGRLLEVASTGDLFARPDHPYTRALLAANPAGAPRRSRLSVIPAEWSRESLEQLEKLRASQARNPVEVARG